MGEGQLSHETDGSTDKCARFGSEEIGELELDEWVGAALALA